MTPAELLHAAETRLTDAENNLASCIASLNEHKTRRGGVPNPEVVQLAHAQAAVAQTYATLAMAKAGIALAEGGSTPVDAA
jgi:hypothetical protein